MKEAVTKVIDTLTQKDFHGAFQKLLERYNKCIAAGWSSNLKLTLVGIVSLLPMTSNSLSHLSTPLHQLQLDHCHIQAPLCFLVSGKVQIYVTSASFFYFIVNIK